MPQRNELSYIEIPCGLFRDFDQGIPIRFRHGVAEALHGQDSIPWSCGNFSGWAEVLEVEVDSANITIIKRSG